MTAVHVALLLSFIFLLICIRIAVGLYNSYRNPPESVITTCGRKEL